MPPTVAGGGRRARGKIERHAARLPLGTHGGIGESPSGSTTKRSKEKVALAELNPVKLNPTGGKGSHRIIPLGRNGSGTPTSWLDVATSVAACSRGSTYVRMLPRTVRRLLVGWHDATAELNAYIASSSVADRMASVHAERPGRLLGRSREPTGEAELGHDFTMLTVLGVPTTWYGCACPI